MWLSGIRRYVAVSMLGNLVWETAQIPLYTLWTEGSPEQIAYAVLHCTGGDLLIALSCLMGALLLVGNSRWPADRFLPVAGFTMVSGLFYTIFSEWLNVEVRQSWAYAASMPTLPPLGTGLTPVLQWLVVPSVAMAFVRRAQRPA